MLCSYLFQCSSQATSNQILRSDKDAERNADMIHLSLQAREGGAGGGSGADPLLIQELTLTVEDLERQVKNLKDENEQVSN